MKVKLDENLARPVARECMTAGHETTTVLDEGLGGENDLGLFEVLVAEDRMLVTLDRGFGDIRQYSPGTHPGMIILRPHDQKTSAVRSLLRRLLADYDLSTFQGCVVVVSPDRIRVRRPQGS